MIASNALQPAYDYIAGVKSGDIVACRLIKLAVERFERDLQRQESADFPYYFDPNAASIALDFYSTTLQHTVGHYSGTEFELRPFQAFGTANIHGWKRISDRSRRFRHVYWSQARKNGKSSWGAGQAIFCAGMDENPATGKPEQVAEVILCATKRDQAKIIYDEAARMVKQVEWWAECTEEKSARINFLLNSGYIETVGSDKPYDGKNPHCVIKDEVHAWLTTVHQKFYNTITTGGAFRKQPLDITVTTAGDSDSAIWLKEYAHARGVLEGVYTDETTFVLCHELDPEDDPLDEANWVKANPNLITDDEPDQGSVSIEYLREQVAKVHDELSRQVFTRYHGNRSVSANTQAISLQQWDACQGELSDWSEADAIGGGVDLGGRDDLAAYALVARFETGQTKPASDDPEAEEIPIYRYEMRGQVYIGNDVQRDLTVEPFAGWIHTDRILQREYPIHDLKSDLVRECLSLGVYDVAFDPAQAQHFAEDLTMSGLMAAAMQQSTAYFTEPISELRESLRQGRFRHDGDPVLRWCVNNALAKTDGAGRTMLDKGKSPDKIDMLVAGVMALRRCQLAPRRLEGPLVAI